MKNDGEITSIMLNMWIKNGIKSIASCFPVICHLPHAALGEEGLLQHGMAVRIWRWCIGVGEFGAQCFAEAIQGRTWTLFAMSEGGF
jgi:hypothetical protein